MATLYQSYMDIIARNQDPKTQQVKDVFKHNYIAYLLPHIQSLYNNLTSCIITQYYNTYNEHNYAQYYPNSKDYWKSVVSTNTTFVYHALLRLLTLSSLLTRFETLAASLPILSTSQTTPISPQTILSQQPQQYSSILKSTYDVLQQPPINTLLSNSSTQLTKEQQQQTT
eukprot:UN02698